MTTAGLIPNLQAAIDSRIEVIVIGGLGSSVGNGAGLVNPDTDAPLPYFVSLLNTFPFNDYIADNESVNGSVVFSYATALAEITDSRTKAVLLVYGMNDGLTANYNFGQTRTLAQSRTEEAITAIRALGWDPILVTTPHPHPDRITVEAPSTTSQMNYPVLSYRQTEVFTFGVNESSNGSFETDTTGWNVGGTNTLTSSTEQAVLGSRSAKATYQDNANLASHGHALLSAGTYQASIWVYVPSNYDGATVRFQRLGDWTSASGDVLVDANLSLRDQWQRLEFTFTHAGTSGTISVRAQSAPTAGRHIYIDDYRFVAETSLNRVTATTSGLFNVGDGATGLATGQGLYVASGLNEGLYTIDAIDSSGDFLTVDEGFPSAASYSVQIRRANLQPEDLIPPASESFITSDWLSLGHNVVGSVRHADINAMFRTIADDMDVALIDAERYWFAAVDTYGYDLLYDTGESVHPNKLGVSNSYWLALEAAVEEIRPVMVGSMAMTDRHHLLDDFELGTEPSGTVGTTMPRPHRALGNRGVPHLLPGGSF